ncbi:hypothetical protein ABT124_38640 [Streptomyces sp. NPDC001982]
MLRVQGRHAALHAELTAQRTRTNAAAQAGLRGATREIQAACSPGWRH